MAIAFTSITPVSTNMEGKLKAQIVSLVVTGTYSAGGTVLSAAEKAKFGADGKVVWVDNDPANLLDMKYNTSTGAIQLYLSSAASGTAEAGAISGAGTYVVRVWSVAGSAAAPAVI